MVGMLLRDETDVVVAGLTYTKGRFAAIDYTVPVFPRWDNKDLTDCLLDVQGESGGLRPGLG